MLRMIIGLDYYKHLYKVKSESVIQPGLVNMERAMTLLRDPQKEYKSIHIAGTNGKGSTLTYIKEMLIAHGLKVGTFMSPGIIDLHDQIQVNSVPVSNQELALVFEEMAAAGISGLCTDFELLTCAAFIHFRNAGVDVAVVEAGMGGRFDSTNVLDGDVAVIPSIALEHTNFLGKTIEEIAWHKAGIIKRGSTVCIGRVTQEVRAVFEREAKGKGATLYYAPKNFGQIEQREIYVGKELTISPETLLMRGNHQFDNAALAMASFYEYAKKVGLFIQPNLMSASLRQAQLPFRFEELLPNVFLDGAHNPASVEKLVALLKEYFPSNKITIVLGMLADKDVKQVLTLLEQVSNRFYFMNIDNPRAMKVNELLTLSNATEKNVITKVEDILNRYREQDEIIVITGSLYLLSEVRQRLIEIAKKSE